VGFGRAFCPYRGTPPRSHRLVSSAGLNEIQLLNLHEYTFPGLANEGTFHAGQLKKQAH
jgi:hypothetical protein